MNLIHKIKNIYRGKSVTRILLNESFESVVLSGVVLDVGGARDPDYFSYFNMTKVTERKIIDGKTNTIDFETDPLPFLDSSIDTVVCANVLEHIFNYNHLVSEMNRVLKKGAILVGFVPFLIQYHPDPNDYFRYTQESLKKIFTQNRFHSVEIKKVGLGPFIINFNNIMFMFPKLLRCVFFAVSFFCAYILVKIKPALLDRYPIGFTFICKK